MWIQTEHELTFEYSDFISESRVELRVEPRSTADQTLRSFALAVGPPTRVNRYSDWSGNFVHHFGIGNYHERIEVLATSLVETHPVETDISAFYEAPLSQDEPGPLREMLAFDGPVVRSERLEGLARSLPQDATHSVGRLVQSSGELIRDRFEYRSGVSDFASTTDHLIDAAAGVCQDFAHMQIALLRFFGIPTRYVSGYLHLGTGEDAQSHAWIEAYAGARGWVAYDPTHGRMPDERYVLVGWGRNYDDVAPNRGVFRGSATERLTAVVRTRESPAHDIVDLHEALDQIAVPVFREVPPARPADARLDTATPEQQQSSQGQQ